MNVVSCLQSRRSLGPPSTTFSGSGGSRMRTGRGTLRFESEVRALSGLVHRFLSGYFEDLGILFLGSKYLTYMVLQGHI